MDNARALTPNRFPESWLPKPEDELLHTPIGNVNFPWKDTWFISVSDTKNGASVSMHMTVSANRSPSTRVAVGVSQGGRVVDEVLRSDGANSDKSFGNELARLEVVNLSWDSRHELKWSANLPDVSFEFALRGKHFAPLWDTMFPGYFATGKTDGQFYCHAEQVVTAEGVVQWRDEEAVPFSGFGWRDRGWGRRKTELMWDTGWDLGAAILPDDSVISFMALRNHEIARDSPLPVGAWRSDASSLSPCIRGNYHKDATAYPRFLELEFSDGYVARLNRVRPAGTVALAMQEPDYSEAGPGLATCMRDYYTVFSDPYGREFTLYTQNGHVHNINVFSGADFRFAGLM